MRSHLKFFLVASTFFFGSMFTASAHAGEQIVKCTLKVSDAAGERKYEVEHTLRDGAPGSDQGVIAKHFEDYYFIYASEFNPASQQGSSRLLFLYMPTEERTHVEGNKAGQSLHTAIGDKNTAFGDIECQARQLQRG
jgi:hypothetical protein